MYLHMKSVISLVWFFCLLEIHSKFDFTEIVLKCPTDVHLRTSSTSVPIPAMRLTLQTTLRLVDLYLLSAAALFSTLRMKNKTCFSRISYAQSDAKSGLEFLVEETLTLT